MPELNLQDKAAQEAAIIYGNKFLRDDFPISDPFTGASLLSQKPQTVPKRKFWITSAVVQEDRKTPVSDWPENEDRRCRAHPRWRAHYFLLHGRKQERFQRVSQKTRT